MNPLLTYTMCYYGKQVIGYIYIYLSLSLSLSLNGIAPKHPYIICFVNTLTLSIGACVLSIDIDSCCFLSLAKDLKSIHSGS